MSGVLHGVLSAIAAAVRDAFFKYVTLLLHGDGTNGAQNNTFLDGSTNAFTITRNGNTTQGNFSPFSQTGWSNYFDGTGDYLTAPDNAAWSFGSGDFTVEAWYYPTGTASQQTIVAQWDGVGGGTGLSWLLTTSNNSSVFLRAATSSNGSGVLFDLVSTSALTINAWNHVALVRSGTTFQLYLNGAAATNGSTTNAASLYDATNALSIGATSGGTQLATGYISNVRVLKGTAQYSGSTYTVPTSPLTAITNTSLLTCQSNRFIDNSSNAFAITRNGDVRVEAFSPFNPSTTYSTSVVGGSGYFDGTGDFLDVADNTAFDFGSGDFTVETFVYLSSLPASTARYNIFGQWGPNPGANDLAYIGQLFNDAGTMKITLDWSTNGTTSTGVAIAASVVATAWLHIAWVRNGTSLKIFLNGTEVTSGNTISGTLWNSSRPLNIGRNEASGGNILNGYLSNFRIVKGTAVYTANFTPPTAPLTAITNTSLLLNFTNGGIFDNASQTVLETVGNAQISTAQSKFGGGSMYFDGTGDWLTAPDRPAQRFGTADFTVEGWLYLGATGAARGIISKGTASTGWSVNVTSGDKLQFSYTASNLTGTSSLSASTWYYFTAMRTGGSIRVYLNGTQEVTNSTAITDNFNQTNILYVGADRVGGSALNGYLDDIRITNGYARYNNFTVPSAALTPTAYTAALPNTSTTNGAQNNTFLDGSTNNFTITRNGNTTQGTFSPFSNSGWSNFFDGTGDYLTAPNNAAFDFGSGDFTIESWIYVTSNTPANQFIYSKRASSAAYSPILLYITKVGALYRLIYAGSFNGSTWGLNTSFTSGTIDIQLNSWVHVALVRSGSTFTSYVNGVGDQTFTGLASALMTNTDAATVAAEATNGGNAFNGYISNVRIVKGTAVYTANFTPPTSPLTAITNTSLLTCQSNRFIDNSTNAFAITRNGDVSVQAFSPFTPAAYSSSTNGGSGYFDGTGDYLSGPNNAAFAFGTGDFTVEFFVYTTSTALQMVFDTVQPATTGGLSTRFYVYINSDQTIITGPVTNSLTSTNKIQLAAWNHVAVVRSGTSRAIYINGVSGGSATLADNLSANYCTIGFDAAAGGTIILNGYLSNLRIVKGTAVYTSNFTPPTAPLTNITNTSLLCNFTNAGIFDAVGINNYETVGNAQASTTQAKFGTTSMYFDGTGDWLTAPDRQPQRVGSGDFTIEGWFYLSAINVAYGIVSKGTSTTGWSVNITSGNKLQFSYTSSNLTGATTLAASTWYHFAVVRSGGTVQIYLNGVQDAISSSAITTDFNQTNILYIGADRVGGSAMNGYLDDIRITPGQALYPGNFTPPIAPFPNN